MKLLVLTLALALTALGAASEKQLVNYEVPLACTKKIDLLGCDPDSLPHHLACKTIRVAYTSESCLVIEVKQ